MQLVRGIMLCERTERERRDEGESTYNQYGADDQEDKLHPVGWQGAGRDRDLYFRSERPGDGKNRNDDEISSAHHRQGQCQIVEWRIGVQAGEGTAVGRRGGGISVE